MADKILSQAEVDALLNGVTEGKVDTQAAPPPTGARAYDLSSQERIIRGRMPTLEIVNDRFARFFQVSISTLLRKPLEFSPVSIDVRKFGEFIRQIPLPSSINLVKMYPLRGHVLLVIDAQMVYLLLDHFFGGSGQTHVKAEGRDFTPIEQRFIRKIVNLILQDLQKAWTPVKAMEVSFVRAEINPQYAMVVAPTEVVVVIVFKLEIEDQSREIFFCLPYPTIEPIREKLYSGFQSEQLEVDSQWMNRFKGQLEDCGVSMTAELGTTFLSVEEVTHLKLGDVIVLDKGVNDSLTMKVEGRPKLLGKAGMSRGNLAFQVTSLIRNHKEADHGE